MDWEDCWDVLGIEPYSDKRTIKITYAKLLKKTRPDEDPEGFKALHDAYKEALDEVTEHAEETEPQWFVPADSKQVTSIQQTQTFQDDSYHNGDAEPDYEAFLNGGNETTEQYTVEVSNSNQDFLPTEPYTTPLPEILPPKNLDQDTDPHTTPLPESKPTSYQSQRDLINTEEQLVEEDDYSPSHQAELLERDWTLFLNELESLLETKIKNNRIADWSFLKEIPSMIDLEFRSQASDEVFENIAEINKLALEKRILLVKSPVLTHLNDFFQWDKKWQHYEDKFYDDAMLDAVYPYIHEKDTQGKVLKKKREKRELFYYKRIFSFVIDAGGIFGVTAGVSALLSAISIEMNSAKLFIVIPLVYFLFIIPILEASIWQASIGKRIIGIQVVNKIGLRIPWYQSFIRSLISIVCIVNFKIVIWINLILSWTVGWGLVQDIISQSYIIEGRYGRKE